MDIHNLKNKQGLSECVQTDLLKHYPGTQKIEVEDEQFGGLRVFIHGVKDIGFPEMRVLDAIQKFLDRNQPEPTTGKAPVRRQALSRTRGWPVPTPQNMHRTEYPTCHGDVYKRAERNLGAFKHTVALWQFIITRARAKIKAVKRGICQ